MRFETDGFSVYGVIVDVPAPTGVNDLDGRTFTIKLNGYSEYVTDSIGQVDGGTCQFVKTNENGSATIWQFEAVNAEEGQYNIFTLDSNNEKKYMRFVKNTDNSAHAALGNSDNPQVFTVSKSGDTYQLSAESSGIRYYLNRFDGANSSSPGFAGWFDVNAAQSKLNLNFITNEMQNFDQYMLVTKYEGEYYVVLNDGRLEKVENMAGDPIAGDFTTPMTWNWDGSHLFHNSLATGYTSDQRASDYYRRYVDPTSNTGLTQEHGKYSDNTAADPEKVEEDKDLFKTEYVTVGPKGKKDVKVTDRTGALNATHFNITGNNQFNIYSGSSYLGVKKAADGTLMLTGNKTSGEAADFWFAEPGRFPQKEYVTLDIERDPVPGEQYYLVIVQGDNSYIINPDRTLSDNRIAKYDDTLTFARPGQMQLWTYDADSKRVYCTYNGQRYDLNPYDGNGITTTQPNSGSDVFVDKDGAHNSNNNFDGNSQIRGFGPRFFKVDGNQLRNDERTGGLIGENGSKAAPTAEVYFAKLSSVNDMQYADSGSMAQVYHMVNHIDISIQGETTVDVPLAYGTYKYIDPNTKEWRTFTVSNSTTLELSQKVKITEDDIKKGTVSAFIRKKNTAGQETGEIEYKNDLFTITGYSANETTAYSTDQVRIEGNFKVANLAPADPDRPWEADSDAWRKARLDNKVYYAVSVTKPVTFMFQDANRGQIYDEDGQPLSITLDINFSAAFNYWDYFGPKEKGNNECPPLQPADASPRINGNDAGEYYRYYFGNNQFLKWQGAPNRDGKLVGPSGEYIYHKKNATENNASFPEYCNDSACGSHMDDWEYISVPKTAGGIGGYGNSGMDFVLGGDAGEANSRVVALNINKRVVDKLGNLINPAPSTPVNTVFDVYYKKDGECNAVASTATPVWKDKTLSWQVPHDNTSGLYDGYTKLHSKQINVGTAGMGLIYDYSVQPGMFYIEEERDKVPETITDTKGQQWDYSETVIETEYVWRADGDTDNKRHVSQTYNALDGTTPYNSIPEVLGSYHDTNNQTSVSGRELRNGFLMFYVYNVYEPRKVHIEVEKKWEWQEDKDAPTPPNNASINVTLGRYQLVKDPNFTPTGVLHITDSCTGLTPYEASYTVICPNGDTKEIAYRDGDMSINGLAAGEYVVIKTVPAKDGYDCNITEETRFVDIPSGGEGTAAFNQTVYTSANEEDLVNVCVAVRYPFGEDQNDHDSGFNTTKYQTKVPKNTDISFTYDKFYYSNWGEQKDVKWRVYDWTTTEGWDVLHWQDRDGEHECPNGAIQTVNVGETDTVIMIQFHDPNAASSMGIKFIRNTGSNSVTSNSINGQRQASRSVSRTQSDTAGVPESPIEGYNYEVDKHDDAGNATSAPWSKTIALNNDNNWLSALMNGNVPLDLPEYDSNGRRYVYYISQVEEQNIPGGTQIEFDRSYKTTVEPETNTVRYTFTVTNRMPDSASVRIKKVSELNPDTLLSATFDLYKWNTETNTYDKLGAPVVVNGTSDAIELKRGRYKLVETQVPEGYVKTGGDPEFDVKANNNGEIVVTYNTVTTNQSVNELTVQNTPKGALKITKVVQVDGKAPTTDAQKALTNGTYTFKVTDANGGVVADKLTITYSGGDVTNPSEGYVEVGDLIPGAAYTIEETSSGNLTLTSATGGTWDASTHKLTVTAPDGGSVPVEAVFTNNIDTGSLTVSKTVVGSTEDKARDFNFTVTLAEPWNTLNGVYGDMTFTNGVATFTLRDGQQKTATGLPVGAQYTVKEETVKGFVTTIGETTTSNTASGTISQTTVIPYTNTRREVQLSGTKTWVDGKSAGIEGAADHPDLTFELYSVTGEAGNEEETSIASTQSTDANGRYYLNWDKSNNTFWSYSITHLPKQDDSGNVIRYRVKEVLPEESRNKYAADVAYSDGTVDQETGNITDANFVNTELTQITVTKTWKLNGTVITEPDEIDHITLHLNRTNGGVKYIGSDAAHTVYDNTEDSGYAPFTITKVVSGEGEQTTVTWPTLTVSNLPKYYRDGNQVKAYTYFFVEEERDGWKANYSADKQEATTSASAATTTGGTIDIENTKSSVRLPSTGGHGTTLYHVLGTLLALAAVALMIARRRAQVEE